MCDRAGAAVCLLLALAPFPACVRAGFGAPDAGAGGDAAPDDGPAADVTGQPLDGDGPAPPASVSGANDTCATAKEIDLSKTKSFSLNVEGAKRDYNSACCPGVDVVVKLTNVQGSTFIGCSGVGTIAFQYGQGSVCPGNMACGSTPCAQGPPSSFQSMMLSAGTAYVVFCRPDDNTTITVFLQ